jgi:hypothetical protein
VKSITAYRQFDTQWTEDNDVSPLSGSLGAEHLINHTFTQELRLNGKLGSLLDYTVGGFYLAQVTTYPTHQILDYIPLPPFFFPRSLSSWVTTRSGKRITLPLPTPPGTSPRR